MPDLDGAFAGTARFEVRSKLGAGGMGIVYEAFDRERGTSVALKTLRHGADARALSRFKNEFRALQRIEHPNLVGLGELHTDGAQWFFTMELVTGVDLIRYVRHPYAGDATPVSPDADTLHGGTPRYDEARLRGCVAQLADALVALHTAGVVHRDVKPSNVLVTSGGRAVLLDFGLALDIHRDERFSTAGGAAGTAAYMAPEQALGEDIGPAADWYAFGVVLYEALTGRLPHEGATAFELLRNKQSQVAPRTRASNPAVPGDLDDLCSSLLMADPQARASARLVCETFGIDPGQPPASTRVTTSTEFASSTPFVGRDAEFAQIEAAFEKLRATPGPRAVYVEAPSGMGKTTLLQQSTRRFASMVSDVLVLSGRCYENELVPYKAFDGVMESLARWLARLPDAEAAQLLPRHTSMLTRVFPSFDTVRTFARAPLLAQPTDDPHQSRARGFAAVRELFTRLTDRRPVVLLLDDMQWVDADSLLLLEDLLRAPDPPRLLLLIGARVEDVVDLPPLRERLGTSLGTTPTESISLDPLSVEAGADLARVALREHGADPSAAAAIAVNAGGHPLFIAELCRHAASVGSTTERPALLDDAIAGRISDLPEDTRRVLVVICVAEAPLPREVLEAATGLESAALTRHITRLRVAYLARTSTATAGEWIAPYHARVGEALLARLDPALRRDAHRRLAEALQLSSVVRDAPDRMVRHLEAAGEDARAAFHAEGAARRAAEALAFDRAAALYRTAIRLGNPADDAARALQLALARALVGAGRGSEAADAFLAAADDPDPNVRLGCRGLAAEQLIVTGHLDRGMETLRDVLADIGEPLARTPGRALASVLWRRALLRMRGLSFRERHASEIAPSTLTRTDVLRVVSFGLGMIDNIRGADFNTRFLLAALRAGEPSRIVTALAVEAVYLASQGERGRRRSRAIHARVAAMAKRTGDPYHQAWVESIAGITAYLEGRFGVAAEVCGRALRAFREGVVGATWEENNLQAIRMFALRYQGDFGAVREQFLECVADAVRRGDLYLEATFYYLTTPAWLGLDDVGRALDTFARARWTPPAGGYHLQHWYALEARGEIAIYRGDAQSFLAETVTDFAAVERSLLMRVEIIRCAACWLRARLLLHAAPLASRGEIARLCRQLARDGVDYAVAFAELGRGALADQTRDADAAVRHLRTAIERCEASEMRCYAAAARWRLATILGGDEGSRIKADAEEAMASLGVVNPQRMVEFLAPGFAT